MKTFDTVKEWVDADKPLKSFICGDCEDGMREMGENEFDLCISDLPYGIGADWKKRSSRKNYSQTTYRNTPVEGKFFNEVRRVCEDSIIWGYNYYTTELGSTNYLIIWDKLSSNNQIFHYSKCEIAYTTFKIPCNIVKIPWDGYRMGQETGIKKIHPHQKPRTLYLWLLDNYAKDCKTILDTHVGSASSLIEFELGGFDWLGFEKDRDYFDAAVKRFDRETAQANLFKPDELIKTIKQGEIEI